MKVNKALLRSAILACLIFGIGEFRLMLSDWLTVLHSHVLSREISFSLILNDLQKGCWLLAIQFLLPRAADVSNFSHPPSPWLS